MNPKKQKTMKKTIVAAALSFAALTITAQNTKNEGKTLEERVKIKTEQMAKKLALSNEQKEKTYNANLNLAKQMQEIREQIKSLHEKQKALLEEHNKEMKSILSDEQYQKYLQMREEIKEKHKEKHKERQSNK